jgi:hypothetical protein
MLVSLLITKKYGDEVLSSDSCEKLRLVGRNRAIIAGNSRDLLLTARAARFFIFSGV